MNPLQKLHTLGQSPWLDFIRRDYVRDGRLAQLRDEGIRGVTSNPAIFEQAIAGSDIYDEEIQRLAAEGHDAMTIYDILSVGDVASAADVFLPVWEASDGRDGYVSLEVSPLLAHDTNATIADAHRLHRAVNRPNVMIKIPATLGGVPAIRQCLSDGIPINVTLLFGRERYAAVMQAYADAMQERADNGRNTDIASVASFFVSRVDSLLDPRLEEKGRGNLVGELAVANALAAYGDFREFFDGPAFEGLLAIGTPVQRVLWASTSAKNPAFSPVKYVEALIGPDSVNTMPLNTIESYLEMGKPEDRAAEGVSRARQILAEAKQIGIDTEEAANELESDAVQKFVDPFQKLISSIEAKRLTFA
ncbi:MAG: transaldolase [Fimbriimonadaceae bacterium]|nr:transaldolase [Fimbriimonadaceae bacterium]